MVQRKRNFIKKTTIQMTETEQTLRQRFTAFLQAMYNWETEANRVYKEVVKSKNNIWLKTETLKNGMF